MAIKIAAFVITLLINAAIGVAVFFFMLLAMNGYNGSDAEYGLGAYIILAILISLLMSGGAVVAVQMLMKREFRAGIAALIAIPIFSVIGAVLKIVSSIIGILIAEYVRVNY